MQLHFRSLRLSLVSALLMGTLAAHAQSAPVAAHVNAPPVDEAARQTDAKEALNAELFYEILVGEMASGQGDLVNAIALMQEAARRANSEQLYQRVAELALQSRNGERALAAAQEWKQAFPRSRDANRFVLQILIALNRVSDTVQPLQQEINSTPAAGKPAAFLGIAQLYSRVSDKALAAAVVEQALAKELRNPTTGAAAWATVGHLRITAGQKSLALDALRQAHKISPESGATALLALELMEAGLPEAEFQVQAYLQHQPSAAIRMAYARVLMGYGRSDTARQQLDILTNENPEFTDAWIALADLQLQNNELEAAQRSLQQFIPLAEQVPDSGVRQAGLNQAYLMQANIALQLRDEKSAVQWLDKIAGGQNILNVQSLRATILARQGKLAQARALIRAVPTQTTEQERLKRRAEVRLLREADAPQEAYLLQRTLLDQSPDDNDIAYDTALLAEKAGKFDTAERLLRDIIERQPDYQHAYNALGYALVERNERLDEAKALIQKALEMSPKDPYIMDSLGWVEFKLGNNAQALTLLENAYGLRDDVEIGAHLGEVLWQQGQTTRARAIWKRALDREPGNETLLETLKRLGVQP
ncbi:tetratricopeptide repeat protein [Comamonas sp. GB3 AK4-5]|uniref:tetratricopeptide repeat protein n=1 Tax=Comamonas sp. GB3 AK4-5 TaxID=3231487 RepID=UPI00351E4EEE